MKVLTLLATGYEDLEAIGTIALLRRAGIAVDVCSVENLNQVSGHYEIKVEVDVLLSEVDISKYDALFLPGGMPGVDNLYKVEMVHDIVKHFFNNKILACICAAPSIPGRLGLLKGRNFTCYPGFEDYCQGGIHEDKLVVVDNNLITGKAAGCVHEFAFAIISKLRGEQSAKKIKTSIYY